MDETFARNYDVKERLDYLLSDRQVIAPYGMDGHLFGIESDGIVFQVVLPFGKSRRCAGVTFLTTPNPNVLCVSLSGEAYLVRLGTEPSIAPVGTFEVCEFVSLGAANRLVLINHLNIYTITPAGEVRASPRLSDDGLDLVENDAKSITLHGYDAQSGEARVVTLDLSGGEDLAYARIASGPL